MESIDINWSELARQSRIKTPILLIPEKKLENTFTCEKCDAMFDIELVNWKTINRGNISIQLNMNALYVGKNTNVLIISTDIQPNAQAKIYLEVY